MKAWRFAAGLLLAGVGSLATVSAQEVRLVHRDQERDAVVLRASVFGGSLSPGAAGFVRLEAENLDARPRLAAVEVTTPRGVAADLRVPREFALAPGERSVAFLPLPRPLQNFVVTLRVDGVDQSGAIAVSRGSGVAALVVADRPDAMPSALAHLQQLVSAPETAMCPAAEAPPDWRLYSSFDIVLVDGRARLDVPVQEALRRAAFAGALVVVNGAEALGAGPLRTLALAAPRDGVLTTGFGRIGALPPLGGASLGRTQIAAIGVLGDGVLPLAEVLMLPQPIPGLGEAPVSAFVLVMLLFAIAAGPINFIALRRMKRPLLVLLTVPLLGFGTTIVILAYGLLNDGFGVRGTVTSFTWLDQGRHEVAAVATRTLFAGLAPGALAMGPDSLLLAPRTTSRPQGAADRWHYDATAGALDGGLLPSRTPTPCITIQQGVARARLVARRQGADTLQLQADGGVTPVGRVVMRDLDGAWFVGDAPRLQRTNAAQAAQALAEMGQSGSQFAVEITEPDHRFRRRWVPGETSVEPRDAGAVARALFAAELPPGGYVTKVGQAPWLDEHGMTVAYDRADHWLRGRMQAEDFLP